MIQIASLHIYPVKSCGAVDLSEAKIGPRGFENDRNWIIVNSRGEKVTQREHSRLALVRPSLEQGELTLDAPNMPTLAVSKSEGESSQIDVWDNICPGIRESDEAAAWFSEYLGEPAALYRFDGTGHRPVDTEWAGESGVGTGFSDITQFLVANESSLTELNKWRADQGMAASRIDRFRANIVLSGLQPWQEDEIAALETEDGSAKIELVRPCSRCRITDVDQQTGVEEDLGNLHILGQNRKFRNYLGGAKVMFGVQAITLNGEAQSLRVGQELKRAEVSTGLPGLPRLFPL
jgi:uncharacterized protein YcbX